MRKLLCLLLLIFVPPVPGETPNQAANESKTPKDNADTKQTVAKPIITPVIDPKSTVDAKGKGGKEKKSDDPVSISTVKPLDVHAEVLKDWMDRLNWVLAAVLVIIGSFGVLYARKTLKAIQLQLVEMKAAGEQTNQMISHAGTQADAALLNAKALIASERPWFVSSVEIDDKELGLWKVRIVNKGRTPGHLNAMFSEHTFVDIPDNLPIPPKYESFCYVPDTRFFATGESFTDRERIPGFKPDFFIENERKNQTDTLVIYGRVIYSDTFMWGSPDEIIHETRWCYFYQPPPYNRFVPCGPKEYNGYRDRPKEQKPN